MGHIQLAAPVAHVWYTRRVPSYLGVLLDISRRNLDRVLYFAQYVITSIDEDAREKLTALGYIGSFVDPSSLEGRLPGDPKEKIVVFNQLIIRDLGYQIIQLKKFIKMKDIF